MLWFILSIHIGIKLLAEEKIAKTCGVKVIFFSRSNDHFLIKIVRDMVSSQNTIVLDGVALNYENFRKKISGDQIGAQIKISQ